MKKFNWLDAAIILVMVLVAIGGIWYLNRPKTMETTGQAVKIKASLELREVHQDIANQYKIGEKVVFGSKNIDEGIITDIIVKESRVVIENTQDGFFTMGAVPNYNDVIVVIELSGTETQDSITTGNEFISVGTEAAFHGRGMAGEGYIVGIELEGVSN